MTKYYKHIMVTCALLLLSTIAYANNDSEKVFNDLENDNPYHDSIILLYDLYIIDGTPEGNFEPKRNINRAEFAKILVNTIMWEENIEYDGYKCFDDIDTNAWYAKYVCTAKKHGIVKGDANTNNFRPADTTNTAEALSAIANILNWQTSNIKNGEQWYSPLFHEARKQNVLAENFIPSMEINREKIADILAKSIVVFDLSLEQFNNFDDYYNASENDINIDNLYCDEECQAAQSELDFSDYLENWNYNKQELYVDFYAAYEITETDTIELNQGASEDEDFAMWKVIQSIIPREIRNDISEFHVFSDGEYGTYAYVEQSTDDNAKWILAVDPSDFHADKKEFLATVIHEYAHIFSLGASQITPKYFTEYDETKAICAPSYASFEGCAKINSYINTFYQKYWSDIINEHEKYNDPYFFYLKHSTNFVNDYAATNPEEDFAESFVNFILDEQREEKTIADKKVNFFYNYPELVELRKILRNNLKQFETDI